jgi:hypothetical protein
MNPLTASRSPIPRVAFYGRTERWQHAARAVASLCGQYQKCRWALPAGALVAAFFDLGAPARYRPAPAALCVGGALVARDGGLDDLVAEAGRPRRRFDFVIACGSDRLSRNTNKAKRLLYGLAAADVEFLVAPLNVIAGRLPWPMELRCPLFVDALIQLVRDQAR